MPKITFIAAGFLLLISCLAGPAFSQTTGGVKGKIKNLNGDGISGAAITARLDQQDVGSTKAARNGEFTLDGLQPGVYNFVIEAKGYGTGIKYGVEVKSGKVRDLGGNLILQTDRGSLVTIRGSVFFKDGTSVPGCEVAVSVVGANGELKKLTTLMTGVSGEFSYRRPEGKATYRFTANFRGVTASKDLSVDTAAIYTTAVLLPIDRGEKQP
jgi:hypothetical protein